MNGSRHNAQKARKGDFAFVPLGKSVVNSFGCGLAALDYNSSESRILAKVLGPMDTRVLNAKARRPKAQRVLCYFASLQCYLRKLCILRKVFHALFSLFAPVHVVWLRLAALRLGDFALKDLLYP
jgi:hypothetical protein